MKRLRLIPSSLRAATLTPPISKSDALRALVLADVTGQQVALPPREDQPSDVRVMVEGLARLRRSRSGEDAPVEIDCADGGAPFRFLLAQAALPPARERTLTGTARLGQRPRSALIAALREALGPCGLKIGDGWPVQLTSAARTASPALTVDAAESGQFASALLLAAARQVLEEQRTWRVAVRGPLPSEGYVTLTLDWLRRAGFKITEPAPGAWELSPGGPPQTFALPGDWSSLGYLVALAWKTGSSVERVDPTSVHPDRAILRCFQAVGGRVLSEDGQTRFEGALSGTLRASGTECPDLLPTLAAFALGAGLRAQLDDVEILRAKESDRVGGIQRLVATFGGEARLEGGSLHVQPPERAPRSATFDPSADHRLAMSAAVSASLLGCELFLEHPDCVEKSFPTFWDQLRRLGATLAAA